jgi:osmotically-inducible protein OsmY
LDVRTDAVVVTLTGQPTIGASAKASEIACGVPGVKSVKNELTFTR